MVFAVALNLTGSYGNSEDIVQETFLRSYQRFLSLSDPSQLACLQRVADVHAVRM